MQTTFNEHLPWSHRLETGPAECAERLNNNSNNNHDNNSNNNNNYKKDDNNNNSPDLWSYGVLDNQSF